MAPRKQLSTEHRVKIQTLREEGNTMKKIESGENAEICKATPRLEIEQWNWVLWFDESKFKLFGWKRHRFFRQRSGERCDTQCDCLGLYLSYWCQKTCENQ